MDELNEETISKNMPLWKRLRKRILDHLISLNYQDYDCDSFKLPTNPIRAHQRKSIVDIKPEEQEAAFFDNFLVVCKRAANTPLIQCMIKDNKITWFWGADERFMKQNPNICRWCENCFDMGTMLFDLQLNLSRLQNDKTNGPIVYTYCSLVIRYLRKHVFNQLDELGNMEGKNLLTLQRYCGDLNNKILRHLGRLTRKILEEEIVGGELINCLFQQKGKLENFHIVDLLEDIISLAIERYYQIVIEWISQCTLTFDLAHEFFIWDLHKQNVVDHKQFERANERLDFSNYFERFVKVPQLIPEDFHSISDKIYEMGIYLHTMKQQRANMDLLSAHFLLDPTQFNKKPLGEFCKSILKLYKQSSQNILEHFKQKYAIVDFAKELPRFYIGLNSTWIYEFIQMFEQEDLVDVELDQLPNKIDPMLKKAFEVAEMNISPYYKYFELTISQFLNGSDDIVPPKGTFAKMELHVTNNDAALKLAFPAVVLEPYRKIFYHLFVINRAKYLVHKKCFMRNGISQWAKEECATAFLFIRFINVYHEYICNAAATIYTEFTGKLDKAQNLDELVALQLDFVNELMEEAKLDQENLSFKEQIVELSNSFCLYACDEIDFLALNKHGSPIVGQIKKFLLENRRNQKLSKLKNLLFGYNFSAIGASADDEPLWLLLQHMDKVPEN